MKEIAQGLLMHKLAETLRIDAQRTKLRIAKDSTDFEQGLWEGLALGLSLASAEVTQLAKNLGFEAPAKEAQNAAVVPLRKVTKS